MLRWRSLLGLLALTGLTVSSETELNQNPDHQQQCQGMYSRKSWGGAVDPFILTTFRGYKSLDQDDPNTDPILAAVVFEWDDYHLLGVPVSEGSTEKQYVCDESAIEARHCTSEQLGTFILAANASAVAKSVITTRAVHLMSPDRPALNYPIVRTGYYCISTIAFGDFPYTAITEFRNAYGELPGGQISKLPFYGSLAIVYAVIGAFWAFLYVQNRRDILAVQNYISATIIFLVVEMIATWGYYDHMNRNGSDLGSKILVVVVAILNALRNSLSFFLLLLVCMGYGVVHGSLGQAMIYARILAITHFVFGVIYGIASLSITPEDAGPLVLLVVLPLAASLTAFYVWTLNALSATTRDLLVRKQHVKAMMYRKLWWLILGSVLVIFAFFFINSFTFAGQSDPDFTPTHWQTRWFVLDGWLNLVYLADVCVIAYLWRPTANNRRFAMSDEISQDDDGNFEIASVRSSMDLDDMGSSHKDPGASPPNGNASYGYANPNSASNINGNGNGYTKPDGRDSPLPAPQPQRPLSGRGLGGGYGEGGIGREERRDEGETIFAVGEEGGSEEDSEDERGGLTKGKGKGD